MHIVILNGPNLNRLGKREKGVYGNSSFEEYLPRIKQRFQGTTITYQQTNHEGLLVDWIHSAEEYANGVVLNAGGYTHTSIALRDAIASVTVAVIEIHISNILARESFRAHSYIAPVCAGTITGFGLYGYELAIQSLLDQSAPKE